MLGKEEFFSGISRIGNIPASHYNADGSLVASYQFPYSIRYLLWSDESVTSISNMLGFTSPSYFAKVFRRATGSSPAEYRAEHRR